MSDLDGEDPLPLRPLRSLAPPPSIVTEIHDSHEQEESSSESTSLASIKVLVIHVDNFTLSDVENVGDMVELNVKCVLSFLKRKFNNVVLNQIGALSMQKLQEILNHPLIVVVLVVTPEIIQEVNQRDGHSSHNIAFELALQRCPSQRIIPLLVDPSVSSPASWHGVRDRV